MRSLQGRHTLFDRPFASAQDSCSAWEMARLSQGGSRGHRAFHALGDVYDAVGAHWDVRGATVEICEQ